MTTPASVNLNTEHLRHLGFKPGNCADAWKRHFKRSIWGHCQCCAFPIKITRLISSIIDVKYYGKLKQPPGYFIINPHDTEIPALTASYLDPGMTGYYAGLTNKQKVDILLPVCYRCWMSSMADYNYSTFGMPPGNSDIAALLKAPLTSLDQESLAIRQQLEADYISQFGSG